MSRKRHHDTDSDPEIHEKQSKYKDTKNSDRAGKGHRDDKWPESEMDDYSRDRQHHRYHYDDSGDRVYDNRGKNDRSRNYDKYSERGRGKRRHRDDENEEEELERRRREREKRHRLIEEEERRHRDEEKENVDVSKK